MTQESTMQPFAKGDILVGCTLLNNPEDDHAGPGRIIQYDADLNKKGELWTEGTTHLVGGLKFGPDGNLWAFDSNAHRVLHISPEGKQLPETKYAERSFSHCNFAPDGTVLMGEHLLGDGSNFPEWMGKYEDMGTALTTIPGEDVFGHGHIFRFSKDGELIKEYQNEAHGGMTGFLGCTTASLSPDGKTMLYSSETGPRVMQYDLEADKQLPDFLTFAPREGMVLVAVYRPDGTVLMIKAVSRTDFVLQHLTADAKEIKTYELPSPGWAIISPSIDDNVILIGNFFSGTVAKFDLDKGEIIADVTVGVERSLAGIAQYPD
ncbi:MAG: PD40 domain-containing protein [Gammaproteobacteria bacterium]|nr:PD40 domain-containing protein [Gammaproteobacteria bacterium]